jgi:ATP-binding cassette subfamily A (ABC1) protein 3
LTNEVNKLIHDVNLG